MLDSLFGRQNFVTEVVWNYGTPSGGRASGKKPVKVHDTLFVYAAHYGKHLYNRQFTPYSEDYITKWFRHRDEEGRAYQTRSRKGKEEGRAYRTRSRNGKIVRQYLDESPGIPLSTVWSDVKQLYGSAGWFPSNNKENVGYPTQKPLALLYRIVKASSNEGDVVLDPFCGCATACVAAQDLKRQWVGIDISSKAADLVEMRMGRDLGILYEGTHRTDIPQRTDLGKPKKPYNHTDNKRQLYADQGGYCNGCKSHFEPRNFHVDHIIPRAKGGTDHYSNLQLLCGSCNSIKGIRSHEHLLKCLTDKGWIKHEHLPWHVHASRVPQGSAEGSGLRGVR